MERWLWISLFLFICFFTWPWPSKASGSDLVPVCVEESSGKDVDDNILKPSRIQELDSSRKCIVACLKRRKPTPCKAAVFMDGTCRIYSQSAKDAPGAFIEGGGDGSYFEVLERCPVDQEKRNGKITSHFQDFRQSRDQNSESDDEGTGNKSMESNVTPEMESLEEVVTTPKSAKSKPSDQVTQKKQDEDEDIKLSTPKRRSITEFDDAYVSTASTKANPETYAAFSKSTQKATDDQPKPAPATDQYIGWTPWTPWSLCNCDHGTGKKTRTRTCNEEKPTCRGDPSETTDCSCQQPEWNPWTPWTLCPVTCGGGTQTRNRSCSVPNYCTGTPFDQKPCANFSCCTWQRWSAWGGCSVTCDVGIRFRTRASNGEDRYGSSGCVGAASQQQVCSMPPCCSSWGPWQQCSLKCGTGHQTRNRNCTYYESFAVTVTAGGMEDVPKDVLKASGMGRYKRQAVPKNTTTEQYKQCYAANCPTWIPFSGLSLCSVTCGSGLRTRSRQCMTNRTATLDIYCPGHKIEIVECEAGPCPKWVSWSPWTGCSVTCGYGQKTRTRLCENATAATAGVPGKECAGPYTETMECKLPPCEEWVPWTHWTQCSVTCGMGQRNRSRICEYPEATPGPGSTTQRPRVPTCQGETEEIVPCDMGPCPHYSSWTPWTKCTSTCGKGEQTRSRQCEHGVECVGEAREIKICFMPPCKEWCVWQSWTPCTSTCGPGVRKRQRLCTVPGTCATYGYSTPTYGYPTTPPAYGGYTVPPIVFYPAPPLLAYPTPPPLIAYPTPPPPTLGVYAPPLTVGGYPTPPPAYPTQPPAYPTPPPAYPTPAYLLQPTIGPYPAPPAPTVGSYLYGPPSPVPAGYHAVPSGYKVAGTLGDSLLFIEDEAIASAMQSSRAHFIRNVSTDNMTMANLSFDNLFLAFSLDDSPANTSIVNRTLFNDSNMTLPNMTMHDPAASECVGDSEIAETCSTGPCPDWNPWLEWSPCSATCGMGQHTRTRICTGGYCAGESLQMSACILCRCPTWTEWGPWTTCSASCGPGTRTRARQCPNECGYGYNYGYGVGKNLRDSGDLGLGINKTDNSSRIRRESDTKLSDSVYQSSSNCQGETVQTSACNDRSCSQWTQWEQWTPCSVTCGFGQQSRTRSCSGGTECVGSTVESKTCNAYPCPTMPPYYQPTATPPVYETLAPAYGNPSPPYYQPTATPPLIYETPAPAYPTPPPPPYAPTPTPYYAPTPPPYAPTPPPYAPTPPPYDNSPMAYIIALPQSPPAYETPPPVVYTNPPTQPPPLYVAPPATPALSYIPQQPPVPYGEKKKS